ncbi:LCP family protein [Alicyclobacillus sp. SO9]|uniref:LCP family protein n=1 Tax=Alicyclobacillus sp. SO9 TaxID=2665646 RepID=UPI0018E7573B|nr:LCP family protein [Alicyclobacillus sp. SO9]QQE77051.1 LCP family protein [Alicyclobacillus sp. SO9]
MNRLRRHQRTSQRKTKRYVMAAAAIIIASLLIIVAINPQMLSGAPQTGRSSRAANAASDVPPMIAVFGTDAQSSYEAGQIDSCVLIKFDKANRHLEVLSIPSDTLLQYPDGHKGLLSSAFLFGGPRLAVQLISKLTNQSVSSYVVVHYSAFITFVNAIGGVPVTLHRTVNYDTGGTGPYAHINLKRGFQTLNGFESLEYVRYLDKQTTNRGRMGRQQAFMKAALKKLDSPKNMAALPHLLQSGWDSVNSNLTLGQVADLALNANRFASWPLSESLLPGKSLKGKLQHTATTETSVTHLEWKVDTAAAPRVITNLFTKARGQSLKHVATVQNKHTKNPAGKHSSGSATFSQSNPPNNQNSATQVHRRTMTVTTAANIRSGPATSYNIVASANQGDSVTVVGKSGGWYKVIIRGTKTGYIAGWLVKSPTGASTGTSFK